VTSEPVSPPSPPPRRRGTLRWLGLAALLIAIATAGLGILDRRRQQAQVQAWTAQQAIPVVSVITPRHGMSAFRAVLPGDVEAWYEAPIYARVNGYLKNWYFDYGAHVTKGAILAEIEAPDLDAQLAAAQAALNSAKAEVNVRQAEKAFADTTYLRWRDSPNGVVSAQARDEKKAAYDVSVANLMAADSNVNTAQGQVDRLAALEGFKRIVAPFDGVVTARETDIGALITAGSSGNATELFRVADVREMRIFVQVPQEVSADIHNGITAEVDLPQYPGRTFTAAVATTSEAINKMSRSLTVELHANNPDGLLLPGAYAEVHFQLHSDPDIVEVPTSTLLFREQGLQVALVGPDNRIILRPVTLGRNLGTEVQVLHGLSTSDRVVDGPPDSLAAGDLVRVVGAPQGSGRPVALDPAAAAK
jgi:RND family efflux transporter MFP subunit